MRKYGKALLVWFVLILATCVAYSFASRTVETIEKKKYSELVSVMKIGAKEVSSLVITNNNNVNVIIDGVQYKAKIPSIEVLREDVGKEWESLIESGVLDVEIKSSSLTLSAVINTVFPIILFIMLLVAMSKRGGGGFTKSRAKMLEEPGEVTFDDVAGAKEEKAELEEVVDFLKAPEKYTELGAKIPRGILLVGSPGNGKTLLAKAVAGEAGVPFFSMSGSDFVELYVGVGASRVRDLFEQAKRVKPCIVFIDEIDAVGRKRGAGMGGGHDEREQTLNQLLVEMDGFAENDGVIIIAATNRPDILDKALLRPGRFDRQVVVDYPDVRGREEILKVHSRKKPLSDDVSLERIAKITTGYSGADLANLLNEAAIIAAKKGHTTIGEADINEANLKVMMGAEKRSAVMSEEEKKLTAYHEAGHAIAARVVDKERSVSTVSIIPRGRAGGFTMYQPESDNKMYTSRRDMLNRIIVMLGGRVAEALMLNDISTGASSDIERATAIAREMVVKYGMSEKLGPISYDDGGEVFIGRDYGHAKNYSENTAADIDREIKEIITRQYAETERILDEYSIQLVKTAELLLDKETITGEEFEACFSE